MKRLCHIGLLKQGFSAYLSLVMLINKTLTKDKRCVSNFRHINMRIAKMNLAFPLVRDTFSILGDSKCEILLAMTCIPLTEAYKRIKEVLWDITMFQQCFLLKPENANGIQYIPHCDSPE